MAALDQITLMVMTIVVIIIIIIITIIIKNVTCFYF